jgi:Cellulase (glycosyl hydrolase family 5)
MRRILFALAVLLTACGTRTPLPTSPPPTASPTLTATYTPWPTSTATFTWTPSHTPRPSHTPTQTPQPAFTPDPISCGDLDAAWVNADWSVAVQVLDRLQAAGRTCGDTSLTSKRYAAHINYAVTLENANEREAAIGQYQAALQVNGRGAEAIDALLRLDALPHPTEPSCAPEPLAPFVPSNQSFITVQGEQLAVDGEIYAMRGVNYYPRYAAWDRFLTDGSLDDMAQELDLIAGAGLNTVRIFLWYDPLFVCAPESATPNAALFAKLDAVMGLAARRNLRLIVTLNDLPDLLFRPLYTDYARYDAQTAFIVNRYRDEPAIALWDLRNEGDIDYGLHPSLPKRFEQPVVLAWLAHTAELVRANDPNHLITAGWWSGALATADHVDVLSFHHWSTAEELLDQVVWLKARSNKPIVVEEIGYSSDRRDETFQAQALKNGLAAAEQSNIAGWLVWTAFDFAPPSGQPASIEHGFGLWRTDLSPKPALESLP